MPDQHPTLADIAQAYGLLAQPPYVSLLAQQRALAATSAQTPRFTSALAAQHAEAVRQEAPHD